MTISRRAFLAGIIASSGLMLAGVGLRPGTREALGWSSAMSNPLDDVYEAIEAIRNSGPDRSGVICVGRETARSICEALDEEWTPDRNFRLIPWEDPDDEHA